MALIEALLDELNTEARVTREFLDVLPDDKLDWRPHPKSMTLQELAGHVAEIPGWIAMTLGTDGLDFAAGDYTPPTARTRNEIIALLDRSVAEGRSALAGTTPDKLFNENWTMRTGDLIHSQHSRYASTWHCYAQLTHHRAQLGVYYRLLGVLVPQSYGPTADYPEMVAV
ncbi:MAG: DinB family protein [Bacteroidia bacterium]|nr:DinB family protein [Bacteroidia bacterium]